MKLDYVSIEKRDGVAIVRFDRKANLNAFNEKLVVELTHAAQGFFDDLETHVVGISRRGRGHRAGGREGARNGQSRSVDASADRTNGQRSGQRHSECPTWSERIC